LKFIYSKNTDASAFKRLFLFFGFLVLPTFMLVAQNGPGGVSNNLQLWLKADIGVTGTTNASAWADQSPNGNDATQGSGTNQPAIINSFRNFNPALDFDGVDDFLGGSAGGHSQSYYIVFTPDNTIDNALGGQIVLGMNSTTSTNNFGGLGLGALTASFGDEIILHLDGASGDWRRGQTGAATYNSGEPLILAVRDNNAGNSLEMFADGEPIDNNEDGTFRTINNEAYNIGRANPASPFGTFDFDGKVSEVFTFSNRVSDTDNLRIQSYLALKYGITLDQSITTNYVSSNGGIIWNASFNNAFNNQIAGIGRDDNSTLNQKQSRSSETDAILSIGLGSIAASNQVNSNTFSADQSFLITGNNAGATSNLTASYNGSTANGIPRRWLVQENGTVETIRIQIDKADVPADVDAIYVKNGDPSLGTGGNVFMLNDGGSVWTIDIDLNDGDYFSFIATVPPPPSIAPGGIFSDLTLWLKADDGTESSGSPASNAQPVDTWIDQSPGGNSASQGSGTSQPLYSSNAINFNPGLDFDGTDDLLTAAAGFNTQDYFLVFNADTDGGAIVGFNTQDLSGLYIGEIIGNFGEEAITHIANQAFASAQVDASVTYTSPVLVNARNNAATTTQDIFVDGLSVANDDVGGFENFSGNYLIGADPTPDEFFDGQIAEVISYSSRLTGTQQNAVLSYLALKYGISLDQFTPQNYVTAGGTIIWNATENRGFTSGIAGIGRDDLSALNQKQSTSADPDGVITMGLGNIAPSNAQNSNTFTNQSDFMIWSHNGDNVTSLTGNYNGSTGNGVPRIWKVQETGFVGNVQINIPKSAIVAGIDALYLKNGDAALGTGGTVVSLNDNGTILSAIVNLEDGDFFSLIDTNPPAAGGAPGGVDTDLSLWLKANFGVTGTSEVTSWTDLSGNGNDAVQSGSNDTPSLTESAINFNPSLNFDGVDDFLTGPGGANSTAYYFVFEIDQVIDQNLTPGQKPFGFNSDVTTNAGFAFGSFTAAFGDEVLTHFDGASGDWRRAQTGAVSYPSSVPLIIGVRDNEAGNSTEIFVNGEELSNNQSGAFRTVIDNAYNIGKESPDSGFDPAEFDGRIPEVISYSTRKGDVEQSALLSYLAIKYGITLFQPQNYVNSPGTIVWDASLNTTFNNDIFGIARDDNSMLDQRQSTSSNDGTILTAGLGDIAISNEANTNTFAGDQSALLFGNNGGGTSSLSATYNGGNNVGIGRIWQVEETNTVGTIRIEIPKSAVPSGISSLYVVNGDPALGAGGTLIPLNDDGTNLFTDIDFNDNDYFSFVSQPVAPGDVPAGLTFWLKADAGVTGNNEGNPVTSWIDQSFNGNNATNLDAQQPVFRETTQIINSNPAVDFTGTNGLTIANDPAINTITSGSYNAKSMSFAFRTGGDITSREVIYEQGANARGLNLYIFNGELFFGVWNQVDDGPGSPWSFQAASAPVSPNTTYVVSTLYTGDSGLNGSLQLFINGVNVSTNTSNIGLLFAHAGGIAIGQSDGTLFEDGSTGAGLPFSGEISEFIHYNQVALSTSDRVKIESYLATKYGITLDQSVPVNYVSTSSTITWNGTNNNGFANDIAGIARDDATALNQKQSKSENSTSVINIGLNTIEVNSQENTGSFSSNNSFLILGHNGGGTTAITSNYNGNVSANGIGRIWKVQESGETGTVRIQVAQTDVATGLTAVYVVNGDASLGTGGNLTALSDDGNGNLFANLNLNSGDFFSFVTDRVSPGGVIADLDLWLKANSGVTGSSFASGWSDQSGNSNNAGQPTLSNQPAVVNEGMNFNPVLDFDGNDDFLNNSSGGANSATYYVVFEPDFAIDFSSPPQIIFGFDTGFGGNQAGVGFGNFNSGISGEVWGHYVDDPTTYSVNETGSLEIPSQQPIIIAVRDNVAGNESQIFRNGRLISDNVIIGSFQSAFNQNFNLGRPSPGSGLGNNNSFNGKIAEVISYNNRKGDMENQAIQSYLAIKYGLTLDQSSGGQDYIRSDGSVVWDATTNSAFNNNIAGIGLDATSGLNQTQSRSENPGSIVTIANPSNLNDGEFIMWGNDGTPFDANLTDVPAGINNRLNRVWRVDVTGNPGTVTIAFDISGFDINNPDDLRLLVAGASSGGSFTNATVLNKARGSGEDSGVAVIQGTLNGNNMEFSSANVNDGDFVTMGSTTGENTLPVQLSSFEVVEGTDPTKPVLHWRTETEQENFGFFIERQFLPDFKDQVVDTAWTEIGFVEGQGTKKSPTEYNYTDVIDAMEGTYNYRLRQVDFDGTAVLHGPVTLETESPNRTDLKQNYPNPFNPTTNIVYQLARPGQVTIKVYNILGREVQTLVNERQRPGQFSVVFDASRLSSGVYFVRMNTNGRVMTRKIMLIK